MVFGINSVPTKIPVLGCGEEGNFIQCKTAQLWYNITVKIPWLWNNSIVLQLNYEAAQLWGSSEVLWPAFFGVSAPAREMQPSFALERESMPPQKEGSSLYIERKVPTPVPWLVCPCKWVLQILTLCSRKALSWLIRMQLLWWVKMLMEI